MLGKTNLFTLTWQFPIYQIGVEMSGGNIELRRLLDWEEAEKVIRIGRNLQREYRGAGILPWTPIGGRGVKPQVYYTLEQLQRFLDYLAEHPQEAARRLNEWRKLKKKEMRQKRKQKPQSVQASEGR